MNGPAGNPARGARDPRPPPPAPRNGGRDIARRRAPRAAQTMRGAPNRDRAALTSNVMHR
ncbi:Uncharacterised protein [Burkholderia pseudomallei]|nr:hypothetical protein DR56_5326 [Burkholderia pseudomallei MSHR5858]AIV87503.1 hypothetical protein X995_5345 [Burkholderia pseudomallei B03]AIV94436.1 hypothetical protein X996_5739 [Burkholderia pseudomallei A79A]KGY05745.1 hypothetical protein Y023_130 [Burkholderia pseudomallei A79D]KGY06736.1 hypothetical protein X997_130 [Burkholderia pseudomallei A79C]CAJ3601815.1 Uncharacterised protein [Burkholderia pseudomallei]